MVKSAQFFLFSIGIITASEVWTCNCYGIYNGRMDIYSYIKKQVWEVKRDNERSINAGLKQLGTYTSSYIYSLYHTWHISNDKPSLGLARVYGAIVVSNYLVTYHSYSDNPALIIYDYLSLEQASELLVDVVMATSSSFISALARCSKKTQEKIVSILAKIKTFLGNAKQVTQEVINSIVDFLKKAGPIILIIIAIIIFFLTGFFVLV